MQVLDDFILFLISEKTKLSDILNRHNSLEVNFLFKLKLTLKLVLPLTYILHLLKFENKSVNYFSLKMPIISSENYKLSRD